MINIRTILALTDFSVHGNHALERAARLAAAHTAKLEILYADLGGRPDCQDAATRLGQHARQLARQFGVSVKAASLEAHSAEAVAEKAAAADLLVLSHQAQRSLLSLVRGQPALQLMRLCPCPVLVTRLASDKPYERMLVAVNFGPESAPLVQLACALEGQAQVELFHAVSTRNEAKLRSAEMSESAVRNYREACLRYAQGRLLLLTDSFDSRRNRVLSAIGHGDPARQALVQQQNAGADLLVVGKRRSSSLRDFFCGSVAQRLLSQASTDLLVVPHDFQLQPVAVPEPVRVRVRAGVQSRDRPGPADSAGRPSTVRTTCISASASKGLVT